MTDDYRAPKDISDPTPDPVGLQMEAAVQFTSTWEDDPVNHPSHYMVWPGTEAIDLIRALLTPVEFAGYCKGNSLKYRLRAGNKGATIEDINKAKVYEGWLNVE